jgi:hypothetical protein
MILYSCSLGQKKENSDELTVWGNAMASELIPNDEYMLNITFNTFAQVAGWQDTQPLHSLHVSERVTRCDADGPADSGPVPNGRSTAGPDQLSDTVRVSRFALLQLGEWAAGNGHCM